MPESRLLNRRVTPLILLVLGLAAGFALGYGFSAPRARGQSEFLRTFTLADLTGSAAGTEWETMSDSTESPVPPLSPRGGTARRIAARARVSPAEARALAARFDSATEAALERAGARQRARHVSTAR